MENHKINAAIQLLPLSNNVDKYKIIDKAIECIKNSGLNYIVCPFETVVEGTFNEIVSLIESIRTIGLQYNNEEIIINLKLHCNSKKDLFIDDKIGHYNL